MTRAKAMELARALVAKMSAEEKASQLRYDAPAIPRLNIPAYNWWNEALHGVARAGTATVYPQAISLAAMFDAPFLKEIAGQIALEGRAKHNMTAAEGDRDIYKGLTYWSPNVNIFRDPRWGRGQETYGEDPYLTSRLGVAFVKGLQGEGEYMLGAACAKHYAVHSGPEALRHEFDAVVNQKDLRETYLPAFQALVEEAGVEAVMGAYNRTNGEPCCGSKTLLQDILREEWGFEGHVVSDCWAIRDFHTKHHVTDTAPESAALALTNGCDLNCGNTYLHLLQALQEGLITEDQLTVAAERLFTTRYMLGLFDEGCSYRQIDPMVNDCDEHAATAQRAAERSMVLLKNDGILPIDAKKLKKLAVIGPVADSQAVLEGNYNGRSSRYVTALEGIRGALPKDVRLLYAQGSALFEDRDQVLSQHAHDRVAEAVQAAKQADLSILCLGLDATLEGEEGDTGNQYYSGDKADLELPESQRVLLKAIQATGKPFVLVLFSGSAMRVEEGNAVLWAGYPGQAGGRAIARLLFGQVNPSGRLPVTFHRGVDDLPPFEDYAMQNRSYRYYEGEALYPFGFGLSYTRYAYCDAHYEDGKLSVTVHNQGSMDGEEVVQAYVQLDSPHAPLHPRLCGFQRIALKAGEQKRVTLTLDPDWFTVVNDAGERVDGGRQATLYVGGSQPDARSVQLLQQAPLKLEIKF